MLAFYMNALGALCAAAANLYGVRYGDPILRGLRAAIGALAGFYFGGYVWVIVTLDQEAWSLFFRRVSLVAWALVWCLPPVLGARAHQRTRRALNNIGDLS
jgi:hypothetical protein